MNDTSINGESLLLKCLVKGAHPEWEITLAPYFMPVDSTTWLLKLRKGNNNILIFNGKKPLHNK